MATTPALLSSDEYLHTSYSPDVDFIDGDREERDLGEFDQHGHKLYSQRSSSARKRTGM